MTRCVGSFTARRGTFPRSSRWTRALTGYENLLVLAKLPDVARSQRRERVETALRFVGSSNAVHTLVRSYSGGMIRRLEAAQSVLRRPRVLFLDEPTVGLDPVARRVVWEHVFRLRAEQGTTVFLRRAGCRQLAAGGRFPPRGAWGVWRASSGTTR